MVTDTAKKTIAVVELDDSSHLAEKRKKDRYVSYALEGHHPLIRITTQNYYDPKMIANVLEGEAGIPNIFDVGSHVLRPHRS